MNQSIDEILNIVEFADLGSPIVDQLAAEVRRLRLENERLDNLVDELRALMREAVAVLEP